MDNVIVIGMAELTAVKAPINITTIGLGSCVGICLYDQRAKIAGMSHAMLPDSTKIMNNSNKAKFVDTGITKLISEMVRIGATQTRLTAKIIGGAQMFSYGSANESMKIGDRNIEAAYEVLRNLRIPIISADVGLNFGRTVIFDSSTGAAIVKTISHGTKTI